MSKKGDFCFVKIYIGETMYNSEEQKIEKACNIAIRNIIKEGITDVLIFNKPYEIELLKDSSIRGEIVKDVVERISKYDLKELGINKINHVLFPKKNFGDYRKCALIDIEDEIKYLTIVLMMAEKIEQKRINKSEDRVFSYRLKTIRNNDNIFDPDYTYTSFRQKVIEKSKMNKNKVILECDISNFYDRLNLHRLESTLHSMGIDTELVKLLNELLLFWSNRDSYGLPVGSNASRILAEAELSQIDDFLISRKIDFCRFVDDYRIFCKNSIEAHRILIMLIERLGKDGLFLNCSKTKIKLIDKNNIKEEFKEIKNNDKEIYLQEKSEKNTNLSKVISGYSGLIPVKYKELTETNKKRLQEEDEIQKIKELKDNLLIDPKDFKKVIDIIMAKKDYNKFTELSEIINKFPQFIPLYYDVLSKSQADISDDNIEKIRKNLKKWMAKEELPEYILIYIARIFNIESFCDKEAIFDMYRKLNRNSGNYIPRALLECLEGKLERSDIIELKNDYYQNANNWEKREIIRIVKKGLYEKEAGPFLKDIKINANNSIIMKYVLLR